MLWKVDNYSTYLLKYIKVRSCAPFNQYIFPSTYYIYKRREVIEIQDSIYHNPLLDRWIMEIIQTCCGHPFYLYYLRFVCWKNNNLMVYSFENFGFGYLASILLPAGVVTKVTFANLHINWKNTMFLIYIYLLLHILRAASCKKSTRKNKLIRKNKSTRTEIFRYKISVLVDLFFLINLFFSY